MATKKRKSTKYGRCVRRVTKQLKAQGTTPKFAARTARHHCRTLKRGRHGW